MHLMKLHSLKWLVVFFVASKPDKACIFFLSQANQGICLIVWFKGFTSFMVGNRTFSCVTLVRFLKVRHISNYRMIPVKFEWN